MPGLRCDVGRWGVSLPRRDFRGRRFGRLTVESADEGGWLCRCDCGGFAVRTSAHLVRSIGAKHGSMCRACLSALGQETLRRRNAETKQRLLAWWNEYHNLYSYDGEVAEESALRAEVGAELGGWDERLSAAPEVSESDESTTYDRTLKGIEYAMELEEVGKAIGVCRERARVIQEAALAKCRREFYRLGIER